MHDDPRTSPDLLKDTFELVIQIQAMIEPLVSEMSRISHRVTLLEAKSSMQEIANQKLLRALFEGNGTPSVSSQLVTISQRLTQIESHAKEAKESYRHRAGLWVAIGLGFLAMVGQLLSIIFK